VDLLSGVSLPFCEGGFFPVGDVFNFLDNLLVITKSPLREIPQSRSASSGVNVPSDGICKAPYVFAVISTGKVVSNP
jgi:hypothetical protein